MHVGSATSRNDTADQHAMAAAVSLLSAVAVLVVATLAALLWASGPVGVLLLVSIVLAAVAVSVIHRMILRSRRPGPAP